MSEPRSAPVPRGRLARLARLGGMAGGVAGAALADGAARLARGQRPSLSDVLLTPGNARRVADQLARMRGAAMKMGQLLSMDAGELLPPEMAAGLARLREGADPMPPRQLRAVLNAEWGRGWEARFRRFEPRPVAAASIGQVHRAWLPDGTALAVKVQYPGVRDGIDADVDNLASLLRVSRVLPAELDVAPLLAEAKRQLREEADYEAEAGHLRRFGELLAGSPDFTVPAVVPELTTASVLAMTWVEGVPVETLVDAPQGTRDRVATLLAELTLRELFDWGWMQTDPNFANYRYQPDTGRIALLDFGATRALPRGVADSHRAVARVGLAGDGVGVEEALAGAGLFDARSPEAYRRAVVEMFDMVMAPIREGGLFDFGDPTLMRRLRDRGLELAAERNLGHLPPADTLFLQRKAAGMFLLASRLRARVPVRALLERYVQPGP